MLVSQLNLLWPGSIVLLTLVPLLVIVYMWLQQRKRKYTVRYSSLSLIRPALGKQSRLRRHVPPALFLLALTSLIVSLARPTAVFDRRRNVSTVMLVMDVSASMMHDDIQPNRLKAAEAAALSFVQLQPTNTQIGIVTFSSDAQLILPPTTNHDLLNNAILSLTLGNNTAMGSGISTALQVIAQDSQGDQAEAGSGAPTARQKGLYAPETIILLTDGYNTVGPPPLQAAEEAAQLGIRIFTIGIGARQHFVQPDRPEYGQPQIPQTGGDGSDSLGVDELTLRKIAALTGGAYYRPEDASELNKVFAGLSTYVVTQSAPQEISVAFIALGALLACVAMVLSQLWHPLIL